MGDQRVEDALGKMRYGVYVISTRSRGKVNAMAAAWLSRVSFDPPLLMVSIARRHLTHEMIKESGVFAMNVLAEDQIELGKRFGLKSGREVDKFAGISYTTMVTGSPILEDALASLDCRLTDSFPAGDHTIFVGEIAGAVVRNGREPLIFRHEDFFS